MGTRMKQGQRPQPHYLPTSALALDPTLRVQPEALSQPRFEPHHSCYYSPSDAVTLAG